MIAEIMRLDFHFQSAKLLKKRSQLACRDFPLNGTELSRGPVDFGRTLLSLKYVMAWLICHANERMSRDVIGRFSSAAVSVLPP